MYPHQSPPNVTLITLLKIQKFPFYAFTRGTSFRNRIIVINLFSDVLVQQCPRALHHMDLTMSNDQFIEYC